MGKVTIDQLAGMMKNSFDDLGGQIKEVKDELKVVNSRLDRVEVKLDHIEGLVEGGQERRISRLEDDVRVIKTSLNK